MAIFNSYVKSPEGISFLVNKFWTLSEKNIACFEHLHYGKTSTKKIQKVSRGAGSASGASKVTG